MLEHCYEHPVIDDSKTRNEAFAIAQVNRLDQDRVEWRFVLIVRATTVLTVSRLTKSPMYIPSL